MDKLVTVTIRSTHYYLIDALGGKLMIDAGWAGSLPELRRHLKRAGVDLSSIRYVMITHHHPDHAGLAQEIKEACGARLVIHEVQVPFLEELKRFYAGKGEYIPFRVEAGDIVITTPNRDDLLNIGIRGEIVETPGHSSDSVSLVLDNGAAFIGDLHPPDYATEDQRALTCLSWEKLLSLNARQIYPAHGDAFLIEGALRLMSGCA